MAYVDGFILAVPKANLETYKEQARLAGSVWKEFGALEYVECIGNDVPYGEVTSFPQAVKLEKDETVVLSWIVYKSREDRDRINAEVMKDERWKDMGQMPFDGKRMLFGGFKVLLAA